MSAPTCAVCGAGQLDGYGDLNHHDIGGGVYLLSHNGCAIDLARERDEERLVREEEA